MYRVKGNHERETREGGADAGGKTGKTVLEQVCVKDLIHRI